MGNCTSNESQSRSTSAQSNHALPIGNNFETKEQLTNALHRAGLERCNLLFAIDFTKSNTWQGSETFGGKSLHQIDNVNPPAYATSEYKSVAAPVLNPYQYIISNVGSQLDEFDDDGKIPTIIFGHARNRGDPYIKKIGPRKGNTVLDCEGVEGVLVAYENAVDREGLSGGTCFAPVISWANNIVRNTGEYHILVIIGDGCIGDMANTRLALANASRVPLSIVFVGVGDGSDLDHPTDKWNSMRLLDDSPTTAVDNWQSLYLSNMQSTLDKAINPAIELVTMMLMEVPEQYKYFKRNGLIT